MMLQPGEASDGIGTARLATWWTAASRGRTLLAGLAGAVLGDPQLVVDARCAHRPGEEVGAPAIGRCPDDTGQRHFTVVDLDVDHGAAAARRDGE